MWLPPALWDALTPDERKLRQDAQERLLGYNPTVNGKKRPTNEPSGIVGQSSGNLDRVNLE